MRKVVLATGIDGLRRQHAELTTRALAKIDEIKDGMPADQVRALEAEHAEIAADVKAVADAIAIEERRAVPAPAPAATPAVASPPLAQAPATDAIALERARAAQINELATRHAMPATFAAEHIAAGTAIDQVRGLVLDQLAARAPQISNRTQVINDERDTMRAAVEASISLRADPRSIKPDTEANRTLIEAARQWRGMKLLELGRTYVEETTGERLRGLGPMQLSARLLNMQNGLSVRDGAGGMSTSDFPAILANVISKRLREAYLVAPQNWKLLATQSNAPDFKQRAIVQLSNLPQLKKIVEGGEYQYAALADGQEKYSLGTYGTIVKVTRQTLINDDLGAFARLPMLLGRAAAETEAGVVWAILTGNPNMNDGVALFHANHNNLGSAAAISITSLNAGRAAMRKQTGLAAKSSSAEPLNLTPRYLVVSPDKETEAQQFLATTLYPSQGSQVNPFAGSMLQITEARLTGNTWYLFADPATVDTIEYAYLEGEEGLYTETRIGFEVDGLEIKGRLDFAAKAIDWRGMYKNPGA